MKIVTASHGSIAAAGDITITINNNDGAGYEELLQKILCELGITDYGLAKSLDLEKDDRSAEEKINNILMVVKSSAFAPNSSYDSYFADVHSLENLIRSAVKSLREQDYMLAHAKFQKALSTDPADDIKQKLVYDYFVSGYVGFSLASDVQAIRRIITEVRTRYHNHFDRSINISIAEAHQEVATRQASDDMLIENEQIIDDLLATYGPEDLQCLNLQGLLYRRFGERKSSGARRLERLETAISVFETISRLTEGKVSVEATNNWAISLIRQYELSGDIASLDEAERLLEAIDYDSRDPLPLLDFLSLPKALNNLGNIHKQRLASTGDVYVYTKAVETYGRTERFWNEGGSPYEWAMIQKNKAEARCAYMEANGYHKPTAQTALDEIDASMKYRNQESAPYQYQRSLDVKARLQALR